MAKAKSEAAHPTLPTHGASRLPSVDIDSYHLEIEDEDRFAGDKASKGAFRELLPRQRAGFITGFQTRAGRSNARRGRPRWAMTYRANLLLLKRRSALHVMRPAAAKGQPLGSADAARILEQTLQEEKAADKKLTAIAEDKVN